MTRRKTPFIGVGCVVTRGGRLLLVQQRGGSQPGAWAPPGGHLDFGESPDACAVRETLEESGVPVADVVFLAITNDLFEAVDRHYVTIWMQAEVETEDVAIGDPAEISQAGWFDPSSLPQPLFLSFANLVENKCWPPLDAAARARLGHGC